MNDKKIIVAGLIIFILIVISPFLYNLGNSAPVPEIELSAEAKAAGQCVESKEFMKKEHMQVLDIWRNSVVREGKRIYTNSNGKEYNMSLSTGEESCLGCHSDKTKFCDRCHDYASVSPYCWDCHIDPKEKNNGK